MAVYTSTQAADGMVAVKYGVGASEASVTAVIGSTGNVTTPLLTATSILVTGEVDQGAVQGAANSLARAIYGKGAIVDSVATDIITVTVPNVACSAIMRLLIRSGITTVAHIYDSTRVVEYLLTVTRVPGAAAVGVLSAAVGAQIATSAGGRTLTTTPAVSAITGAVGASNSFTVTITNVLSVAGISETAIVAELLNGAAGGVTMAQAP